MRTFHVSARFHLIKRIVEMFASLREKKMSRSHANAVIRPVRLLYNGKKPAEEQPAPVKSLAHSMTTTRHILCCLFLLASLAHSAPDVPVMDGGAGACSLELLVTTADGNPVQAATVKVHIAYGFAGIRRLDLEAGTNAEGKLKFIGLPSRVHRPPLEFHASKGLLAGLATYNPAAECQAKHQIVLDTPPPKGN